MNKHTNQLTNWAHSSRHLKSSLPKEKGARAGALV